MNTQLFRLFVKTRILAGFGAVLLGWTGAHGAVYTETFSGGSTSIPDGNPDGVTFSGSVSDIPEGGTVTGLSVNLTVSGGYNGDLYAYLAAPNGTMVVLLNRPGVNSDNPFGGAGSGMHVILVDSAATSIQTASQTAGAVFSGTYQPAGALANLNGLVAAGTWSLFVADLSGGGGQAVLEGWSLDITTPVPEMTTEALAAFGTILLGCRVYRKWRARGE